MRYKTRVYFIGLLLFVSLLSACGLNNKERTRIAIGPYVFDFPASYYLEPHQGIDSYVGIITNDTIELHFDYGFYSNKLLVPFDEFYEKGSWRLDVAANFMEQGIVYDINNTPEVEILDVITFADKDATMDFNENQFFVLCANGGDTIERFINIPDETMQHDFIIDTIDNYYRKIVIAKDPQLGTTGIYMKKVNNNSENTRMFYALMLAEIGGLTKEEQELLIGIFNSVKIVADE